MIAGIARDDEKTARSAVDSRQVCFRHISCAFRRVMQGFWVVLFLFCAGVVCAQSNERLYEDLDF